MRSLIFIGWAGALISASSAFAAETPQRERPSFNELLDALPIADEIDTATSPPVHQSADDASKVERVLDRPARLLPMGDRPKSMAWVIGQGKGLKPGQAYVLEIEYPDDIPRAIFVANRGADHVRGFATGSTFGDSRQQFVQPSVESIAYPQTGKWQVYRSIFFMHDRFQGLYAQRDPKPGGRPHTADDGFHVIVFQTKRYNDPRSAGVAIGRIRLRHVPDPSVLYAKVEPLPDGLPKRRVFYREEMSDESISAKETAERGVDDPVDWFLYKARLNRMLSINTFAKDLLEFGFNQGWDSGDQNWYMNAQPPLSDVWDRLVRRVAAEGLDLLPYYEYKGGLGLSDAKPKSLGWQRRASKLYHNQPNTQYSGVWWTEDHNADLTDPDTLADAKRLLDRTLIAHKDKAKFAGAWFRVRDNHLPISFAASTIERFKAAHSGDAAAQSASQSSLIASYEGDCKPYDRYINWWLDQRAEFFQQLQQHVANGLGDERAKLIFTPWTSEQIPMLREKAFNGPVQVATDDPQWWDAYAKQVPSDLWFRWALVPTSLDAIADGGFYRYSLEYREPVSPLPWRSEPFHSAPNADPARYRSSKQVMLTYPAARLFTIEPELMAENRTGAGLTMLRHYTLNEDNHDHTKGPSDLPFDGLVGYISVDVDRAGQHVRLLEARAVAAADPTNLGYLCGSSFSIGFPEYIREFNRAYLSLPALLSTIVPDAASDNSVVVREIKTPTSGTYYYVVNTSFDSKQEVRVTFPVTGNTRDLVTGSQLASPELELDLHSGELRSYHILP